MFIHVFIYRFKCLIRDRALVFWTLLFPILLGTFFYLAFMNLNHDEVFHPINTAVIPSGDARYDAPFQAVVKSVSEGKGRIFNLKTVADRGEADQLLKKGKISGYFTSGREIGLTVRDASDDDETGLEQSIMKSFADQYRADSRAAESIAADHPQALNNGLLQEFGKSRSFARETAGGGGKPDNVLNYFYSLIAMACMYGGFWGLKEVSDIQANLSERAARVNMAPVHKLSAFLAGSSAALVILFGEMLALLAYLHYGLHISFGARVGYVLLTALVGSVLGLSFGAFISALVNKGAGVKTAVLLVATMGGSFLSGMMMVNIRYLISEHLPLLAWLNPVNLLTDAFYSLYYYDSLNRYLLNMAAIAGFIVVFCAGTYLIVRRRKYASL